MLLRCGKYQLFKGEKSVCLENMSINRTNIYLFFIFLENNL